MYINQELLAKYLLPINKRTDSHIAWLKSVLEPMQRLNTFQGDYENGSAYSLYDAGTSYNLGELVSGGAAYAYAVYESQTNSNLGNSLDNTQYWIKINDFNVGVNERDNFRANKMVLEYGLNRYYNTIFRQPTGVTYSALRSDIYIEDNYITYPSFIVGNTLIAPYVDNSSHIWSDRSDGFILDGTFFYSTYQYTIWAPNSLISSLPSGILNIRNIADRYNTFGINYDIQGY